MGLGSRQFIELPDGSRVAYIVMGESGPPVMLLNGATTTHFFWDGLRERWPDRRLILWDYPGHGDSPPAATPAGATMDALVQAGLRVLDAIGVERVPVVGYSMGSQLAIKAALDAPDRFSAVVSVLGPAGRLLDPVMWGIGGPVAGVALRTLSPRGLRWLHRGLNLALAAPTTYAVARSLRLFGPETSKDDLRRLIAHLRRLDPETLRAMVLSAAEEDLLPRLSGLAVPLMVISGERDVFAPTHVVGRRLHEAAPDARLLVMADGTHGSLFGHAGTITAAIERFLLEHRL